MGRLLAMLPADRRHEARETVVLPAYRRMHKDAYGRHMELPLPLLRALNPSIIPVAMRAAAEASLVLSEPEKAP